MNSVYRVIDCFGNTTYINKEEIAFCCIMGCVSDPYPDIKTKLTFGFKNGKELTFYQAAPMADVKKDYDEMIGFIKKETK